MSGFLPTEKGTPIRYPSVANLMIDSDDRDAAYPSPWDFQITRFNNLQNGFFTRIAATELVLDWCEPNIGIGNDVIGFDISGVGANTYNNTVSVNLPTGFYTVQQVLDKIVDDLNALTGAPENTGATFQITGEGQNTYLDCSGAVFYVLQTNGLSASLEFPEDDVYRAAQKVGDCPDLRIYKYIDFVSEQLTYAQDVKDAASQQFNRNVLARWYMAWDGQPQLDPYGFPILMGYTSFVARRDYNTPKMIKWNSQLPVGNLAFQVYDNRGGLLLQFAQGQSSWQMNLQLSEV